MGAGLQQDGWHFGPPGPAGPGPAANDVAPITDKNNAAILSLLMRFIDNFSLSFKAYRLSLIKAKS